MTFRTCDEDDDEDDDGCDDDGGDDDGCDDDDDEDDDDVVAGSTPSLDADGRVLVCFATNQRNSYHGRRTLIAAHREESNGER